MKGKALGQRARLKPKMCAMTVPLSPELKTLNQCSFRNGTDGVRNESNLVSFSLQWGNLLGSMRDTEIPELQLSRSWLLWLTAPWLVQPLQSSNFCLAESAVGQRDSQVLRAEEITAMT